MALAWNHLFMGLIEARPLIVVGEDWADTVATLTRRLEIHDEHSRHLQVCDDVDAVVDLLAAKGIVR